MFEVSPSSGHRQGREWSGEGVVDGDRSRYLLDRRDEMKNSSSGYQEGGIPGVTGHNTNRVSSTVSK